MKLKKQTKSELSINDTLYYYYIEESGKISELTCKVIDVNEDGVVYNAVGLEFIMSPSDLNKVIGECFTTETQRMPEEMRMVFDIGLSDQELALEDYYKKEIKRIRKLRDLIKRSV